MRRARHGAAAVLLALLLLPAWLPVASAQVEPPQAGPLPGPPLPPPDPVARALHDLLTGAAQAQEAVNQVLRPGQVVPQANLSALQERVGHAQQQVDRAAGQAAQGPIRRLLYEGFEGGTLQELGWGQEVLRGEAPWGVADGINHTVLRGTGASFPAQDDRGVNLTAVKDGRKAATIVGPGGVYERRVDARLVSPVIDLRDVVGASQRTDDPYEAVFTDPDVQAPYAQLVGLYAAAPQGLGKTSWLFTTPPSKLQRMFLPYPLDVRTCVDPSNQLAGPANAHGICVPLGELGFNPLAARYGAAMVNLTFHHKYSFAPDPSAQMDNALLDGAFLEVRVVRPDGTTGPWEYLAGDTVFEPRVGDHDASLAPPAPSGVAEGAFGLLSGSNDYSSQASPYNGRIQLRDREACWSGDVQCVPDVPGWVRDSSGFWKSHYTLNAWAGHRIQVAWRVHSGVAQVQSANFGWFLDAVQVEALLPRHDPGVHELLQPRQGDVVPTDALLQPRAVVRNHGYLPVEGVLVNFTILQHVPDLTPEDVQAGLLHDADAAVRGLEGDPALPQPQTPGQVAQAGEAEAHPVVVMRSHVVLPRLGPQEQAEVRSPAACPACTPGAYVVRVEASLPLLNGTGGLALPGDRVDDGRPDNNALEAVFEVRDVRAARVTATVPASHLLTDIGEAKLLRVEVENTGNRPLTGVVELTARALDPATGQPRAGEPAVPVGSLAVSPGDLPPGRRLTSYGTDRDRHAGNVTWLPTGLPPAVYRVEAAFRASPPLDPAPRASLDAYIRATPPPYFLEDFETTEPVDDGFTLDLLRRVGFTSAGWRNIVAGIDAAHFHQVPAGSVSTSRVWNATASDGALLEATVLGVLAGAPGLQLIANGTSSLPGIPDSPDDVPEAVVRTHDLTIRAQARVTSQPGGPTVARVTITLDWPAPRITLEGQEVLPLPAWPFPYTVTHDVPLEGVGTDAPALNVTASRVYVQVPVLRPFIPLSPAERCHPALAAPTCPTRLNLSQGQVLVEGLRLRAGPQDLQLPSLMVPIGPVQQNHPFSGPNSEYPPAGVPREVLLQNVGLGPQAGPLVVDTGNQQATAPSAGELNTGSVKLPGPVVTVLELAGSTAGSTLANVSARVGAVLTFGPTAVDVCVLGQVRVLSSVNLNPNGACAASQRVDYDDLEQLLETNVKSNYVDYAGHSFLDDYYLGRRVDLRQCQEPCRPVLSFWHRANFTWEGTPRSVALPGALGGPASVPGGIQAVSPDHAQENRSRGLVEVTVLNATTLDPQVPVRHDLGAAEALAQAAREPSRAGLQPLEHDPCALAPAACSAPCQALPGASAGAVPVLGPWYDERLRARAVCPSVLLAEDPPTARALAAYEAPVPQWRREVLDLSAYRGREVYLDFHLQTTAGRFQTRGDQVTCSTDGAVTVNLTRCFGQPLDHWTLDNIRLADVRADGTVLPLAAANGHGGFLDSAGDASDASWQGWGAMHTTRSILDANAFLHPECFATTRNAAIVATQPVLNQTDAQRCLASSRFLGPSAVLFDGRGWSRFNHTYNYAAKGDPALLNPYWDGWFLDDLAGFVPAGSAASSRTALRFGGPGPEGRYPSDVLYDVLPPQASSNSQLYSIASMPLADLRSSGQPFAQFQHMHVFSGDVVAGTSLYRDGGGVFLDRYVLDAAGRPVFDRRVLVVPEGGYDRTLYPEYGGSSLDGVTEQLGIDWYARDAQGNPQQANGFGGSSGGWRTVRLDLLGALRNLCVREVTDLAGSAVRSFPPELCPVPGAGSVACALDTCVDEASGVRYRNITSFEHDPGARYALSFHAANGAPPQGSGTEWGWAVDDLRVGERLLANDLGVSRILVPEPGKLVGPGERVQPRVNVTNFGYFHQRGARLHFNVSTETGQVFPDPSDPSRNPPGCGPRSCLLQAPASTLFEGHRSPGADHNETLTFGNEWAPEAPGLYTLAVWVELAPERVGASEVPIRDEDPVNDVFTQVVDVRETHAVRIRPPSEVPDEDLVRPLVGTIGEARELRVAVENIGTMTTGTPTTPVTVQVTVTDESGVAFTLQQPVDRILPGQQAVTSFGERAWRPEAGGSYTLEFRVHHPLDRQRLDDARTVSVEVLTSLVPRPGTNWTEAFRPEGGGWSNGTRLGFAAGKGWSFGEGAQHAPGAQGSLVLREPVDLTTFRDAVLALEHRYDFERKYDGGVVEVSTDGVLWDVVEPLGGYPDNLTSASPGAGAPGEERRAFTGDSGGVVRSLIPLGTVGATRTGVATILEDTFDHGTLLQGEELAQARGDWEPRVERTPVPPRPDGSPGKAWWVNKTLVWRPTPPLLSPATDTFTGVGTGMGTGRTTLEGSKELRLGTPLRLPDRDGTIVVEFDEWRALGLTSRGAETIAERFRVPNGVEVTLAPADPAQGREVAVMARAGNALTPYADNYLDWTRRTLVVPARLLEPAGPGALNLVFRLHLAAGNSETQGSLNSNANYHHGGGGAEDTDLLSPHLGWAIANPSVSFLTSPARCEAAGYAYTQGRCRLWEDALAYADTDDPAVRAANWTAAWRTERHRNGAPPVSLDSRAAPGDPLLDTGWRLVEAVGDPSGKPVWDTQALAPARSGHGRVAEARGGGQDARLTTPLDLRGVSGETTLTFDHSYKFSDLYLPGTPGILGASSGGRVEVSRDGGGTWEPLVPVVQPTSTASAFTDQLASMGLRRVFVTPTGTQCSLQRCLEPSDPYGAPGGWPAPGATWRPQVDYSAHTPLGGPSRDPERNSNYGIDSVAFSGTTCAARMGSQDATTEATSARTYPHLYRPSTCEGPEGWRTVRFDLSPYAGEQVLLGFHAWFSTHRCAERGFCNATLLTQPAFLETSSDPRPIPADFWRVDNVKVEGRVLDGKPLHVRLRAFADTTGDRYGWDVLNATLLGGQHLRNLAVRIERPLDDQALAPGPAEARVLNRGQEPARGRGTLLVEPAGSVPLLNGTFEDPEDGVFLKGWTNATGAFLTKDGNTTSAAPEGALALHLAADGTRPEPFRIRQQLAMAPGNWSLVGLVDVAAASAAGITLERVLGPGAVDGDGVYADHDPQALEVPRGDEGKGVTYLLRPTRASTGDQADRARWAAFERNFSVVGTDTSVRLSVHADRAQLGQPVNFQGTLRLDHLRIEARPPPALAPAHAPLRNPGFETPGAAPNHTLLPGDELDGWSLLAGKAHVLDQELAGRGLTHSPSMASPMPDGQRALGLLGAGAGPRDFELRQELALEPGKYRLSGSYASRHVNLSLTRDQAGLLTDAASVVEQTVRARDLPRNLTGVRLWGSSSGSATVRLLDANGTLLWTATGAPGSGNLLVAPGSAHALVPFHDRDLTLRVEGTGLRLEARDGDEYPHGTLRVGGTALADRDLRASFHGPHDPATGQGVLRAGMGPQATASPAAVWPVPRSAEYHVRQVVDVPEGVRLVEALDVNLTRPAGTLQGYLRARLFHPDGRPLSGEALHGLNGTFTAATSIVRLNFSHAFLPPGTTKLLVGFRADNVTGLGVQGGFHARAPSEPPALDAGLVERDRANGTWRPLNLTSPAGPRPLDLHLDLVYRLEGTVRIAVDGAEGAPLVLVQPGRNRTVLNATRLGSHSFALDFTVPGHGPVALNVTGHQFQGEAVLDALRLVPLSLRATTLNVSLDPGGSALLEVPMAPVPGARYAVQASVVMLDEAGKPVPEALLADNRDHARTGPALGPGRLVAAREAWVEAAPNNVDLGRGEAVALRVHVRNPGADDVEVQGARVTVTSPSRSVVYQASHADFDPLPPDLRVPALQERSLGWVFQPAAGLPAGVYRVEASVEYLPRSGVPETLRGSARLYLGTDFHQQFARPWPIENSSFIENLGTSQDQRNEPGVDAETHQRHRWTSDAQHTFVIPPGTCPVAVGQNANNPCNLTITHEDLSNAPYNWHWRRTSHVNLSAHRGLTLGGEPSGEGTDPCWPTNTGQAASGCAPPPENFVYLWGTIFNVLRSPTINITDMGKPKAIWADRHQMPRGVQGDVFARLVRGTATYPPSTNCLGSPGAQSWNDGWINLSRTLTGETAGFRNAKWVTESVDIMGAARAHWERDLSAASEGPFDPDAWPEVQLCWRVQQTSRHPQLMGQPLQEWSIDDIVVSPFAMDMGPSQRWPITDNVTKEFRILLRNEGAYTDTYEVLLVDEANVTTRVPGNWRVEVLDPDGRQARDVRLQPGEARELRVRVEVDVAPVTQARDGAVDLALTAISRTTPLVRRTVHLALDFEYPERSNLRASDVIVNGASLPVDKPRTVDVFVLNTGAVAVEGARIAVIDRMDPRFGVAPEELRRLDGQPLEPFDIAPGDVRVITANWVPRVPGEHNLTIVVDPEERILEFDERDNVLVRPIEVPRAEFPDLAVRAEAEPPNPVPGDTVQVRLTIANRGGAPALGVKHSLTAGVTDLLPGEPPHILPRGIAPGESVTINATWKPAFAGEQVLIARASTLAGILEKIETLDDNQHLVPVKVRSRGLEVQAPEGLAVEPGATLLAEVVLHNRGDLDDTYRLALAPPEGWRASLVGQGEPPRVGVGNRSSATLALRIGPPAEAEAGPWDVRLTARSENSTETVEASVVVRVPQRFGLRFALEPELLLQPGERFLPVTLENSGNGPDVVTVRALQAPAGWRLDPATFTLPARTTAGVRLNASLPTGTPEGAHEVLLEAQGRSGERLQQRAAVQVMPLELLGLRLEGLPERAVPGQALAGTLVVRNEGNQPARADLRLAAPAGWAPRLDRDVAQLAPGEERRIGVGLVVPLDAAARREALRAEALGARGEAYRHALGLQVARADLALLDAELLPRGQVREGATMTLQARVQNRGDLPAAAPMAVFLDDQLVGFEAGPVLEPGAEARLEVRFLAKGGEHVVLATLDPGREVGETDESNNARLLVLHAEGAAGLFATPGPEPGLLLAAAALALAWRGRPRRRQGP